MPTRTANGGDHSASAGGRDASGRERVVRVRGNLHTNNGELHAEARLAREAANQGELAVAFLLQTPCKSHFADGDRSANPHEQMLRRGGVCCTIW